MSEGHPQTPGNPDTSGLQSPFFSNLLLITVDFGPTYLASKMNGSPGDSSAVKGPGLALHLGIHATIVATGMTQLQLLAPLCFNDSRVGVEPGRADALAL